MTREQHLAEYEAESTCAKEALNNAISSHPFSYASYQEYKAHEAKARKHYGIAQAMWTRRENKKLGYKAF